MDNLLFKTATAGNRSTGSTVDTCLILQYHRVGLQAYDPLQWTVEPYNFETHMEYLANNCNVISVDEMKLHIETSTPFQPRTVMVTFDGGYADVLYTAKDILERHHTIASVFSTSANMIKRGQFWWDTLKDYFVANHFSGHLQVEIDGKLQKWPLVTQLDKFRAYYDLYSILIDKAAEEQQEILNQIIGSIDLQAQELDNHRTLDAQELKELDECDLITIGGHTHSGVKLSSLTQWQQTQEISKNKEVLEEVLGHKIEYFSYPFGGDNDSDKAGTSRILKDNHFSLACGNAYSMANHANDNAYSMVDLAGKINIYDLPRVRIENWTQYMFHKFLESFWGK